MNEKMKKISYLIYLTALIFFADFVYTNYFEKLPRLQTEIYLQMLNPSLHQRAQAEGLFYELRPNAVNQTDNVPINAYGMRDKAVSPKKDRFRVLVLGDSITFGPEVKSEELFTEVAERILDGKGRKVEILNAGVCGYNTKQEYIALREHYLKLKPDLVIFTYCTDDMSDPAIQYLPDDYAQKKLIAKGITPKGVPQNYRDLSKIQYLSVVLPNQFGLGYEIDRWLLGNSGIYRALSLLRFKQKNKIKDLQSLPDFLFSYDYERILRKIKKLAAEADFAVRFMVLPTKRQWDKPQLLEKLSRNGIILWDFDGEIDPVLKRALDIWVIDPHLNDKGHSFIAGMLARKIEQEMADHQ